MSKLTKAEEDGIDAASKGTVAVLVGAVASDLGAAAAFMGPFASLALRLAMTRVALLGKQLLRGEDEHAAAFREAAEREDAIATANIVEAIHKAVSAVDDAAMAPLARLVRHNFQEGKRPDRYARDVASMLCEMSAAELAAMTLFLEELQTTHPAGVYIKLRPEGDAAKGAAIAALARHNLAAEIYITGWGSSISAGSQPEYHFWMGYAPRLLAILKEPAA